MGIGDCFKNLLKSKNDDDANSQDNIDNSDDSIKTELLNAQKQRERILNDLISIKDYITDAEQSNNRVASDRAC